MAEGKKSFTEQYKNPKWQKKRLEILERDEYSCTECGNEEKTLHVHHYIYHKNKKVWEYDNKYLITLCDDCHSNWHESYDNIKENLCVGSTQLGEIANIITLLKSKSPLILMRTRKVIEEIYKIQYE